MQYTKLELPTDVVHYIAEIHDGLRYTAAIKIQVWWRYCGSKVQCADCLHFKHPLLLHRVPACADYQIMFILCCDKMVCKYGCRVYCKRGHLNIVLDDDGYRYPLNCSVCEDHVLPQCEWHGNTSPATMRERMYEEGIALSHYVSII